MKNYKFVCGFILSSVLSYKAHAVSPTPRDESRPAIMPIAGGEAAYLHFGNSMQLQIDTARNFPQLGTITDTRAPNSTTGIPLEDFVSYANLSNGFYYLGSSSAAAHRLGSDANLSDQKTAERDISEPASEILLLAGLSALAIAIRRQSPS